MRIESQSIEGSVPPRAAARAEDAASGVEVRRLLATFTLVGACAMLEEPPADVTLPLGLAALGLVLLLWRRA